MAKADSPDRPFVSYVVPTLDRGRYVVRAVESCLRSELPNVAVEVIVIDSMSQDGSFEALNARYGTDPRVRLLRNRRGSGPTRSWIDGVATARGNYFTFVWSDDVISPWFLTLLLPSLRRGSSLAHGRGRMVDIDSEVSFIQVPEAAGPIGRRALLQYYFGRPSSAGHEPSVSPVCSLFSRDVIPIWMREVETFCRASPLREQLMWRRAIGPDLMLYLCALRPGTGEPAFCRADTAQFSSHPNSISISTKSWFMKTGYWLARMWYLKRFQDEEDLDRLADYWADTFIFGLMLLVSSPFLGSGNRGFYAVNVFRELRLLFALARRKRLLLRGLASAPLVLARRVDRYRQKKAAGAVFGRFSRHFRSLRQALRNP